MRTETIQALKDALSRAGSVVSLGPAKPEDIERVRAAGFPQELIEFYADHEPDPDKHCAELEQRIWCVAKALEENTDAVPGIGLFPHGYVVFASTMSGHAYCIDTNTSAPDGQHPVVLFPHDSIDECTELPDIKASRVEVASSLDDFLLRFGAGTLIEKPRYPPC
jgi:hypothetical protein